MTASTESCPAPGLAPKATSGVTRAVSGTAKTTARRRCLLGWRIKDAKSRNCDPDHPSPRAGSRVAPPTPEEKQRAPDYRVPRDRQEVIRWASTLDSQSTPLVPGNLRWTHFLTLTFARSIPTHHAHHAGRLLNRWLTGWRGCECQGARGFRLFRFTLWSAEGHLTGNVHLHALSVISPAPSVTHCRRCHIVASSVSRSWPLWKLLKESWFIHHGIARVFPYDERLTCGAEGYVTKYVLDEKCLDWGVVT